MKWTLRGVITLERILSVSPFPNNFQISPLNTGLLHRLTKHPHRPTNNTFSLHHLHVCTSLSPRIPSSVIPLFLRCLYFFSSKYDVTTIFPSLFPEKNWKTERKCCWELESSMCATAVVTEVFCDGYGRRS